MRETWHLYRTLVAATLQARLAYRWNFVSSLLLAMLMLTAELLIVLFIVTRVHGIGGWNAGQILVLVGFAQATAGMYRVFAAELHNFDRYLVNGEFDSILTRPAAPLFILITRSVDPEQGGWIVQGVVVLLVGIWRSGAFSHPWLAAASAVTGLVTGGAVFFALVTATATLGFWTTRIDDVQPLLLYGPETAASYPVSIYPVGIQAVFYTVIPVALGGYVPAAVMLEKGLPPAMLVASWGGALAAVGLALAFWNVGVRHYTSTGS